MLAGTSAAPMPRELKDATIAHVVELVGLMTACAPVKATVASSARYAHTVITG